MDGIGLFPHDLVTNFDMQACQRLCESLVWFIALVAFAWVMRRQSLIAYAALYFALFMRAVAAGVSFFNLNDEARISDMLGLGPWLLPGLVILVLLIPTIVASRHLRLSWTVNVLAYMVSSLVAAAVVGLDMVHRGTI